MQGEWKCLIKSVRNINKIPCPHVFYSEIMINSISFNFRYTYSLKSYDFSPYEITPTSVYEMDLVVFPRVDQLLTCKQASSLMHEFSASWQFFKTNKRDLKSVAELILYSQKTRNCGHFLPKVN